MPLQVGRQLLGQEGVPLVGHRVVEVVGGGGVPVGVEGRLAADRHDQRVDDDVARFDAEILGAFANADIVFDVPERLVAKPRALDFQDRDLVDQLAGRIHGSGLTSSADNGLAGSPLA